MSTDTTKLDDLAILAPAPAPSSDASPTSALAAVEARIVKLQELAALTKSAVLTAEESAAVKARILAQ